jgi:hypothetical protein
MKVIYKNILFFFIFCNVAISYFGFSQNKNSSFEGTHFLISFMQNEIVIDPRYGGLHLKVFITPSSMADITVTFPPDSQVVFNSVKEGSILTIDVPIKYESFESEMIRKKAIEINSTSPIIVYGFSTQYLTSDGYAAIPVEKWGKEYVVMSYPNDQYLDWENLSPEDSLYKATPRQSEFLIIAGDDDTEITFWPRAITERGVQVGSFKTVYLNKGDCYLVKSFPFTKGYGDLTGTLIRGTKPFGVLSGHVRSAVPQNLVPRWDSKNHLIEMLMPTNVWGREFITAPYGTNPLGDLIRITSIFPNTIITGEWEGGTQTYTIPNSGGFIDIPYVPYPVKWVSNNPIQIAQFPMHSGQDGDSPNFDPAMALIPPLEQFVNKITFQTLQNISWNPSQYVAHYINIVGTIDALDSTYLNKVRLVDIPSNIKIYKLFNDKYFWANVLLNYGKYTVQTTRGKLSGVIYGVGLADAYALVLGSSLNNPYINDSTPPEIYYSVDCGKIEGLIVDSLSRNGSGLGYVFVVKDSTYNYSYTIPPIEDSISKVNFSARPINPYQKGKIVIESRDKNGNTTRFSYSYIPPQLNLPNEVRFDKIKPYDSLTRKITLRSKNNASITIYRIRFKASDTRFSYTFNERLPYTIESKDSVSVYVSVAPRGYLSNLYDTLIFEVDCNLQYEVPINTSLFDSQLKVEGYDFGKVLIGDTALGKVKIINLSSEPIAIDSIFITTYTNIFHKVDENNKRVSLNPSDSIAYNIKFIPKDRLVYNSTVIFYDETQLNPKAEIRGEGIAPDIPSLLVDFGKLRVGRTRDTIIYIKNLGNAATNIKFEQFNYFSNAFDSIQFIINSPIQSGDSIPLRVTFSPQDTGLMYSEAIYSTSWKYGNIVTVKAIGIGTLPIIETYDVVFDTIFIGEVTSSNETIISSSGNEDLFIYDVLPIAGDSASFEIDFSSFKDFVIPAKQLFTTQIKFTPKRIGLHFLKLLVVSDAMPGPESAKKQDTLTISGYAIPRDTIKAYLELEKYGSNLLCNDYTVQYAIRNDGNVELKVTDVKVTVENTNPFFDKTSLVGKVIKPKDVFYGSFETYSIQEGLSRVIMTIILNDSISVIDTLDFLMTKIPQTINISLTTNQFEIGKEYILTLSGEFLEPSEYPFDLKILLGINLSQTFVSLEKPFYFQFSSSLRNWQVQVTPTLTPSKELLFEIKDINMQGKETRWSIDIPFRVFLSEDLAGTMSAKSLENQCYTESTAIKEFTILPVCVTPLRNVEIIEGSSLLTFYPNPVSENLTLEILSTKNDFVKIKIFDKLGNVFGDNKEISLYKGINKVNYDFSVFSNGIYLLKLQFTNENVYLIIIKSN